MAKSKKVTAKMVLTKIIVTAKGGQIEGGKLKFTPAEYKKLLGWIMGEEKLTLAIDGVETVTKVTKLIIYADGVELKNPSFKFNAQQYEKLIKLVQSGAEIDIAIEQLQGELPLGDPNEKKDPAADMFEADEDEGKRLEEKGVKGKPGKGWKGVTAKKTAKKKASGRRGMIKPT